MSKTHPQESLLNEKNSIAGALIESKIGHEPSPTSIFYEQKRTWFSSPFPFRVLIPIHLNTFSTPFVFVFYDEAFFPLKRQNFFKNEAWLSERLRFRSD